jgi:hypothetical protein
MGHLRSSHRLPPYWPPGVASLPLAHHLPLAASGRRVGRKMQGSWNNGKPHNRCQFLRRHRASPERRRPGGQSRDLHPTRPKGQLPPTGKAGGSGVATGIDHVRRSVSEDRLHQKMSSVRSLVVTRGARMPALLRGEVVISLTRRVGSGRPGWNPEVYAGLTPVARLVTFMSLL